MILNVLFPLISGLLMYFSFKWGFIAFFALIPLIYALLKSNGFKQRLLMSVLFSLSLYLPMLTWIVKLYPLSFLNFTPKEAFIIVISGYVLLTIIMCIKTSLISIFKLRGAFFFAFLWIIIEHIKGLGIIDFKWGMLSNTQMDNNYFLGSASIFGALFLSFLIVLINFYIAKGLLTKNYKLLLVALFIFTLNMSYGLIYDKIELPFGKTITVSAVQGNIKNDAKWKELSNEQIADSYFNLTKSTNTDLVVLPESAIPSDLSSEYLIMNNFRTIAKDKNQNIVLGGFEYDIKSDKTYSAAYVVTPEGKNAIYRKQKTVPFGEYIPFENSLVKLFGNIVNINAFKSDIAKGLPSKPIVTSFGKISPLICFDSVFSDVASKSVKQGGEIITVSTNDSWFDYTNTIREHLSYSVLRAVENGRYVVRCANTGVSAIITPKGKIIAQLENGKTGILKGEAKLISVRTPYTIIGDGILIIALLYISIVLLIGFKNRKRII